VVNLENTPLGRSHTPQQVLNGTATLLGPLAPSTTLHLVFGLTPPKLAEEEQFLKDLQDPKSSNFHKYLTADEWNARFAPSAEDEQAVIDWAESNGLTVTGRFNHRLILDVDGSSENVEKALAVKMNNYQLAGAIEFSNDRDPVIPSQLANIVHSMNGLNSIQRLHTSRGGSADPKHGIYAAGAVAQEAVHADGNAESLKQAMTASEEKGGLSRTLKALTPEVGPAPELTSGFLDPSNIYSSYGYDFVALQELGHCCNPSNNSTGSPPATSIAIATVGAIAGSDIAGFQSRYNYLSYYYTPYHCRWYLHLRQQCGA
jgi:subtilase family serine protease